MGSANCLVFSVVLGGWLVLAVTGCSSNDPPRVDAGLDLSSDHALAALDVTAPDRLPLDQEPTCGPAVYPCGPYGVAVGDLAENLVVKGFADPDYLCRPPQAQHSDLSRLVPLSFKRWFQGDPACSEARQKLLWVIVGAGWCPGCIDEAEEMQKLYAAGKIDRRVAVLGLVIQTQKVGEPCTETFLRSFVDNSRFQLTYPVAMDPTLKVTKYIETGSLPGAMLLELATMKILERGSIDPVQMQASIKQHLEP